jgi:thioredoxin 2
MTDTTGKRTAIVPCASCGTMNRVDLARVDAVAKCGACRVAVVLDAPIMLTDATFDTVVSASTVPVIIDFYADWCGPCKQMAPVFGELARRQRGQALVAKVDTDRSPGVASRFGIRSIPTIAVMRAGKEVARQVGAVPMAGLEQLLRG